MNPLVERAVRRWRVLSGIGMVQDDPFRSCAPCGVSVASSTLIGCAPMNCAAMALTAPPIATDISTTGARESSSASGALQSPIFTLPAGYRPPFEQIEIHHIAMCGA